MTELAIRVGKLFRAKIFLVVLIRIPLCNPQRNHMRQHCASVNSVRCCLRRERIVFSVL